MVSVLSRWEVYLGDPLLSSQPTTASSSWGGKLQVQELIIPNERLP